jgi:Uncharacterised nucleotidyltransferase
MDQMIKVLCDITSSVIKQKPTHMPIDDEQTFFTLSKENGLIPFVFESVDKDLISLDLYNHLKKHYYAFVAHDTKALLYIDRVNQILNEHKIKHIFMKGSILKSIYPKTYFRGMGDIDILIESKDLKKVHQIFKAQNIILKHASEQHDSFLIGQEMTIEIHPKLYKDFNAKYEALFSNPWKYAYQKNAYEYRFEPTFEIIYLLYHLAKHLDSGGIGLRSVLDIGVYLDHYKHTINQEELIFLLNETQMVKYFTQIIYLNIKYYHFNDLDKFLFDPLLTDDTYDQIIRFIARSGLHGKGHSYNPFEARIASNDLKNKSRFNLFITLVVPSYKTMCGQYRILKKVAILLPFFWVFRAIKLLLFKTKNTLKRIFQFNVASKDIEEIKNIHKYLGL